jgi:aspartyl-tRNA(Asn)/glutamyl-tRNA(Gln) amidotransferase subunit A
MTADLHELTIAEAATLIARRHLSPVDLTEACLRRIEAFDVSLSGFIELTADRARRAARLAEREIMATGSRGPLHGIPYCLKDVVDVAGLRTTAGSRLLADNVATADAACAAQLEEAGAVLLGKANTWEFAHGGPSWDLPFPPARNPWNTDRSPAGSSSGSAVAVAAGFALGSLGTDTGGSIRSPAAACGVVGLKPTYGLVSRRGVVPNCFSHDHIGPLAWTVRDVAILLQAIAGHDPDDPASAQVAVPLDVAALNGHVEGLIIGVPWRWLEEELRPAAETRAAFDAALDIFRTLGAELREVSLPPLADYHAAMKVIAVSELFAIHGHDLRTRPELFGASLRYRVIAGGLVRAEDYLAATRFRAELARAMGDAFSAVEVMMLPTAEPAGRLEPVHPSSTFTRPSWTAPFSLTGNPALSLCSGFDRAGMPFSLQIVGRPFEETTVLRVGDAYERATPWRARRPVLGLRDGGALR